MSSGAFALYIDQQAGQGGNAPITRIVPLPPLANQDGIQFDHRRLTLSYDNLPTIVNANPPPFVVVTGRFLPISLNIPINVTLTAGECRVVEVPTGACAASFEVDPTNPPHGPISALVEYNS
jgi:hypothetical protein